MPRDRLDGQSSAYQDKQHPRTQDTDTEGDQGSMPFSSVEDAIAAIGRGEIVVVVDDEDRENEGDLIMAADAVTPEKIAFFLAHTSGLICVPLTPERVEQLDLPLMVTSNTEVQRTAFTVSVDYRHGTSTGISAADRAATIKALVDPHIRPSDLNRPGHIFPLRYRPGGVLKRAGHTEAAVDLARAAGMSPAGVLCEVVSEDKTGMARLPELTVFAAKHGLHLISIADLIRYRRHKDKLVRRIADARIPTDFGEFTVYAYESVLDGEHHVALVKGDVSGQPNTLVRVHSECLTGDVFGSGAVRLRAAAPRGDGRRRRERERCHRLPARPRRSGHRAGPQAARLQPARGGVRHRGRQPRARACRRTPASTGSARRSWSTSG